MAAVMWIQMSSFLLLMLQITANGHTLSLFPAGDDDEVTLPCKNAIHAQHECTSTTWFFSGSRNQKAVELVILGKIVEDLQAKSDRLSVSRNCSLVIKKVTVEDVGLYTCRQFNESGLQRGPDFQVHLSVIIMIEHKNDDEVKLYCCVFSYDHCRHRVEWLYEGKEEQPSDIEIKSGYCSTTLTFASSHTESRFYESLKCKATNDYNKKEQLFPFRLHSSYGQSPFFIVGYNNKNTKTNRNENIFNYFSCVSVSCYKLLLSAHHNCTSDHYHMFFTGSSLPYIIVLVCLVALLIVVAFITWKKGKGANISRLNISTTTDDPEDGVNYASINYTKKANSKASAQVHNDEGDTVTYSTVKAPSASLEVSTDPSNLYSTITK
ncbi:centromere protein H [Sarotherodon galilaeus]